MTSSQFVPRIEGAPSGVVMPFFGAIVDVPQGWVVCDGNNGTQDLRDKFVKGTTSAAALPGTTGGAHSKTLSVSQLPSHSHGGSTGSTGTHNHSHNYANQYADLGAGNAGGDPYGDGDSKTTSTNGGHGHSGISGGSTGGDGSFDNKPAYTEALFIQKT
jgi:microcystin-dependent protein